MNLSKLFQKSEETEFTTFHTTLETYAWYKPILILIIAVIVSLAISSAALFIIRADSNSNGIINMIYAAISMIAVIPSMYIGFKLLYKIPFSTQVAPVRRWDWSIYIKAFIVTFIVYGAVQIISLLASGNLIISNTSIVIILLCLILPLFQGFAEEFLCRGLLMQTFGAWFKIPIVAIVLQAAIFAILHPYDILAVIAVFCIGFFYGFLTWYSQGLESSSAMHAVNNMFAFLSMGLGLQQAVAPSDASAVLINLVLLVIPIIIVLALDKKFNWFSSEN